MGVYVDFLFFHTYNTRLFSVLEEQVGLLETSHHLQIPSWVNGTHPVACRQEAECYGQLTVPRRLCSW